MASLAQLAFSFARFVAGEHRRGYPRQIFSLAAARRWNSGRLRGWNSGIRRRHHGNRWVRRRRCGGRRLRGNRWARHGNRWLQRHHSPGGAGPSTTAAVRREHPVTGAESTVVAAPEVAAEDVVGAVYKNETSVSNVSVDADELMPVPPEFAVPPMEWLLGGPSAGWLVDDPERDFSDDDLAAPPPPPPMSPMYYYMRHSFGPCLPSPTPSDEDAQHFAPPGCDPLPEFFWPLDTVQQEAEKEEVEAAPPAPAAPILPDLNLPMEAAGEEENADAAPMPALPTPSPEARVILRRFASAMANRPAGIRTGTWSPMALGLTANSPQRGRSQ